MSSVSPEKPNNSSAAAGDRTGDGQCYSTAQPRTRA